MFAVLRFPVTNIHKHLNKTALPPEQKGREKGCVFMLTRLDKSEPTVQAQVVETTVVTEG